MWCVYAMYVIPRVRTCSVPRCCSLLAPCSSVYQRRAFYTEDGKVGTCRPNYTASHRNRPVLFIITVRAPDIFVTRQNRGTFVDPGAADSDVLECRCLFETRDGRSLLCCCKLHALTCTCYLLITQHVALQVIRDLIGVTAVEIVEEVIAAIRGKKCIFK